MHEIGPIEPVPVTGSTDLHFDSVMRLSERLALLCRSRANREACFELHCVVQAGAGANQVHLLWEDTYECRGGVLGVLERGPEADAAVRTLFPQLRAWRERCRQPRAKAVGA